MLRNLVLFVALTACALAKPVKVTVNIPGMTWGSCPSRVREMLTTVGGVSGVSTDQPKLQATFTYDDEKVSLDTILEKMKTENNGRYHATVVPKPK